MINFSMQELKDIQHALNQSAIVAVTDQRGRITFVNDRFCEISKYERHELVGQNHCILNSKFHPSSFFQEMWKCISSGNIWRGDIRNRAKDGSLYWVQTTIVPFLDDQGQPYQYVSIRVDITAQKSVEKIQKLAFYDSLTGLQNKRMLTTKLEEAVEKTNYDNSSFGILHMDIDGFKRINDSFGHCVGDLFLKEIANRLRAVIKNEECLFRLNADEFIVFFDNNSNEDAKEILKQVTSCFEERFIINGYEFYSSISVGIAYGEGVQTTDSLLSRADMAMLVAKKSSGNAYVFYEQSMSEDKKGMLLIENKLRYAIKNDKLQLHYQPQVDTSTGEIIGVEALIRWFDDELGYIPPNEFIYIAEERGLIDAIGEWALIRASKQLKKWNEEYGKELTVSVNISPSHFLQSTFIEKIQNIISYTAINPKYLQIEITEDSMMQHTKESIELLNQLKKLGVKVAIDDFGTGYSSFSYLRGFPISTIKIDRSFIKDITKDESAASIVEVMIKLGHALGLEVVAEGVELEEEYKLLEEWTCDIIQGFYISKALSIKDFAKELAKTKI